jgi:molecular chaperone GrpE (heat shock protein)
MKENWGANVGVDDPILPTIPAVEAFQDSTDPSPVLERTGSGSSSTPSGGITHQDPSDWITSQTQEQTSLLKSSHGLLVDLSARLTQMSDESIARTQRQLFLDLLMLYDSLKHAMAWIHSSPDKSAEDISDRLGVLESELLEILARRDIRPFDYSPAILDRQMHRTVGTVPTSDSEDNNRIRQVVRTGFFIGSKILRPEDVVISRYDSTLQSQKG